MSQFMLGTCPQHISEDHDNESMELWGEYGIMLIEEIEKRLIDKRIHNITRECRFDYRNNS